MTQSKWMITFTLALILAVVSATYDWSRLDQILDQSIKNGAFPGAVALVADSTGILYVQARGTTRYNDPGSVPMTLNTTFDMASCTKVIATTSAIALLYQHGVIPSLSMKISEIFPEFAVNNKESVTIENCLLHNAGFKPDPVPNYDSQTFACPETAKYHPDLAYSCMNKIYDATMAQTLDNPVGAKYVYSDLSMITLMYVVGHFAKEKSLVPASDLLPLCMQSAAGNGKLTCYFDAFIKRYVLNELEMNSSLFVTQENQHKLQNVQFAPAWNDTTYRHEVVYGYVSDGNAYANGGVCGHAGLFSTVLDVYKIAKKLMFPQEDNYSFLSESTVKLFTTMKNSTQSSRALGWDTNWAPQPYPEQYHFCGTLSDQTYTHTGFTGTQICSDPKRKLISILLSNRVYPDHDNTKIKQVRGEFHSAVQMIYDGGRETLHQ